MFIKNHYNSTANFRMFQKNMLRFSVFQNQRENRVCIIPSIKVSLLGNPMFLQTGSTFLRVTPSGSGFYTWRNIFCAVCCSLG